VADLNGDGRPDIASAGGDYDTPGTVWVLLNTPGLCNVQQVGGLTLATAKQRLESVNCRVGKITRVYDRWTKKGLVRKQTPGFGQVLPGGGKVDLQLSLGRKPKR
jgi:beta-lactam-binding protein with PASTA domain